MLLQKRGFFAAILMMALAVPSYSKPDEVSEARKAIQASYNKIAAASSRLDVKSRYALHSPNFVYVYGRTRESLHTRIERDEVNFRHLRSTSEQYTIKGFRLHGNVATVLCAVHINAVSLNPDTGRPMPPDVIDATQQDTWGKGSKGWLLTETKALSVK